MTMRLPIQTSIGQSIASDVDQRIVQFRQRYPQIALGIRDVVKERLHHPAQLKSRLPLLFKQLDWMRDIVDCHPILIEIIELLDIWPIQLGYGSTWTEYIDLAHQLCISRNQTPNANIMRYLQFRSAHEQGYFDQAVTLGQRAYRQLKDNEQARQQAFCAAHLITLYVQRGMISEAFNLIDDVSKAIQTLSLNEVSATFELNLSHYNLLRVTGKIDELLVLTQKMQKDIVPHVSDQARGYWYHNLGLYEWYSGNYAQAMHYYQSAKDIFAHLGDKYEIILMAEMGLVLWYMGQLEEAQKRLKEAKSRADAELDYVRGMKLHSYLALVALSQGNIEQASHINDESLAMATTIGYTADIIRITGNRGFIQIHTGDYESAVRDLEYDREQRPQRNQHLAWVLTNLSRVHRLIGNDDIAQQYASDALTIARERNYRPTEIISLRALAESITTKDESISLLKEALDLAQNFQLMDEAACCLSLGALTQDNTYWERGTKILHEVGATRWLAGHSITTPPLMPLLG